MRSQISVIAVLCAAEAPRALAECWTRSDGVRVCSAEPAGWVSVWWFWFALLLLLALVTGCWDSCGKSLDDGDDALDDMEAMKAANVSGSVAITVADPFPSTKFTEPLLEQGGSRTSDQTRASSAMKKPSYRYL